MHPILFKIPVFGGITIYTYGVMVALGFVAGLLWIIYDTKKQGLETSKAVDLAFWIILSSIIGSRIFFMIVNEPSRILSEPWSLLMVWEGGLVFYGGFIAAVLAGLIYMKIHKLRFFAYVDVFAPAIALGHAFGRIGCFMAGCCHGSVCPRAFYSITFPAATHSFAPSGVPLYPTQLIDSFGELLIFFILVVLRRYKKFDGNVFAFYLLFYSILRFFNEYLRGDKDRGYIIDGVISSSQGISIVLFTIAIAMFVWGYRKSR